jgi:hypothetical protein
MRTKRHKDITIKIDLSCDEFHLDETESRKINKIKLDNTVQELINDIEKVVNRRLKKTRKGSWFRVRRKIVVESMNIHIFPND